MKSLYLITSIIICLLIFAILYFTKKRKYKSIESTAQQKLKERAKQFSGYYQTLYDCVNKKSCFPEDKLLYIWEQRMEKETEIMSFYNILRKNKPVIHDTCVALLKFVESSGIIHDRQGDISITEKHCRLYLFDDVYELGDTAEIIIPAWYFSDGNSVNCVERGVAQLKEQTNT